MADVYWNLTRRCWSVRDGGRVVDHVAEIALVGVRFRASEASRLRCLGTAVRDVHAWARGIPLAGVPRPAGAIPFTYRLGQPGFRIPDDSILTAAAAAWFDQDGRAWCLAPRSEEPVMRAVALAIALAALAVPAAADTTWLLPPPGLYCPSAGENVFAIVVGDDRGLGIDGLDCKAVRLRHGRVTAATCFANGGSEVSLDTDLLILPSGAMLHDSVLFRRRQGPPPCPTR
ncbi:hypothetical protein ABID82_001699 [Methylobacterium sp. PvP062]|uniref:Uncharacterized protein n=1 Tax=Methylobacterium radiotolerans TaxID=31998 RepID=A0ABV2NBI3_9HYPH|nr:MULTISPECIES: hypothetical protein [unclassified Methylobacterium]MBP2492903.1 hypothetical protein [Methylobacterium sp. PvP105]MBP2500725.1 hypothetical protein [Methylobacterium sp. PvP109]GAN46001.1 hypothetical protein ME121_0004 [Methylobacterium sp. ME121]